MCRSPCPEVASGANSTTASTGGSPTGVSEVGSTADSSAAGVPSVGFSGLAMAAGLVIALALIVPNRSQLQREFRS